MRIHSATMRDMVTRIEGDIPRGKSSSALCDCSCPISLSPAETAASLRKRPVRIFQALQRGDSTNNMKQQSNGIEMNRVILNILN